MSVPIKLPRWMTKTYSMQLNSVDVVLIMALSLRIHGTADAIRKAAMNIRFKVCMEHQPKMKALAKLKNDADVIRCAIKIVQRATDAMGILPGEPFELIPEDVIQDPPRCHMKPMLLAGEPGNRYWKCQHCSHTKPL